MNLRKPPALATWLLQHLGSGYHRESLAGDLFEEYQNGRSRQWYWQQAAAAVCAGGMRRVGLLLARVVGNTLLRFLTEAAALLGVLALAQQSWQFCSIHALWAPSAILTLVGTIALVLSVGFYLSLTVGRPMRSDPARNNSERRKQKPFNRRMAAFALTALSAGTLTWASTSSEGRCGARPCACSGSVTTNSGAVTSRVGTADPGAVAVLAALASHGAPALPTATAGQRAPASRAATAGQSAPTSPEAIADVGEPAGVVPP
jgi:hypothetical protein